MTTLRGTLPAVALAAMLLVTGCAKGNDVGSGTTSGGQLPADEVALRVAYTGGFVAPGWQATRLPVLTVYGDGRVLTQGPQIEIYPAPALPNIQVQRISRADVDRLIDKAVEAGVGTTPDFGQPPIADAATTRFTVLTGSGLKTTDVYALAEAGEAASGLTDAQRAARAKFQGLLDALTDLPKTLGKGAVSEAAPYTPTAVAAVASPWTADQQAPAQPKHTWPGPALPGAAVERLNANCLTVTGEDARKVLTAAATANMATPWTSEGKQWNVMFRPLLPEESDCADLARNG